MLSAYGNLEVSQGVFQDMDVLKVRLEPLYYQYATCTAEMRSENSREMKGRIINQVAKAFAERIYVTFRPEEVTG